MLVNERCSAPCYRPQTLASNLAKSQTKHAVLSLFPLPNHRLHLTGIRLRRDKWVSVRYAEELNSDKSSVLLQRADRHEILDQKPADFQLSV